MQSGLKMKRFADRLREARVAAGLTQEQLGFALGVTKSSVSAWENGRETPAFKLLPKLRVVLKRSLDELVCGSNDAVAETDGGYPVASADDHARDVKERALLQRYRNLPSSRKTALLELLRPSTTKS